MAASFLTGSLWEAAARPEAGEVVPCLRPPQDIHWRSPLNTNEACLCQSKGAFFLFIYLLSVEAARALAFRSTIRTSGSTGIQEPIEYWTPLNGLEACSQVRAGSSGSKSLLAISAKSCSGVSSLFFSLPILMRPSFGVIYAAPVSAQCSAVSSIKTDVSYQPYLLLNAPLHSQNLVLDKQKNRLYHPEARRQ